MLRRFFTNPKVIAVGGGVAVWGAGKVGDEIVDRMKKSYADVPPDEQARRAEIEDIRREKEGLSELTRLQAEHIKDLQDQRERAMAERDEAQRTINGLMKK